MDRNLFGRWFSQSISFELNIFDEEPVRMKISCENSGYYNFEPNCVYEKDGYLCFEMNSEEYRQIHFLKYDNEKIIGYYTQQGKRFDFNYERLSKNPVDGEYKERPFQKYLPKSDITRLEILRQYEKYDFDKEEEPYETLCLLNENIPENLYKYSYNDYIKDIKKDHDEIVFKTLDFVCDHFHHGGSLPLPKERTIEALIKCCEENEMKINCRGLSIILATILRMNGVNARHITCMPYEEPFYDCHVVVDCLLPSGKRIMLDPTFKLYYKDKNGDYVSIQRLREILIRGEMLVANNDNSYCGRKGVDLEYARDYMIKNTFRFTRGTYFSNGSDDKGIELIPMNYDSNINKKDYHRTLVYNEEKFWEM